METKREREREREKERKNSVSSTWPMTKPRDEKKRNRRTAQEVPKGKTKGPKLPPSPKKKTPNRQRTNVLHLGLVFFCYFFFGWKFRDATGFLPSFGLNKKNYEDIFFFFFFFFVVFCSMAHLFYERVVWVWLG